MRAVVGGSSGPGTDKRTESDDNPSLLGIKNNKREGYSSVGATSSKDKEQWKRETSTVNFIRKRKAPGVGNSSKDSSSYKTARIDRKLEEECK